MGSTYEVLLIRHGETHGYYGDVGLTAAGEEQARAKAAELAAWLPGAVSAVRMPHAPTARGRATAQVLRDGLVAALGGRVDVGELAVDHRFDSLQFLHGDEAWESTRVASERVRLREQDGHAVVPDWAAEYDRFDSDMGEGSRAGGPIDRWLTSTTLHFEPPQVAAYRLWAGITRLAAEAGPSDVALVVSHSAPIRAFAAAAFGRDPGEPANLEHVGVTVDAAALRAEVAYRGETASVEVPATVPPWLSAAYLDGERRGVRAADGVRPV